MVFFIWGTAIGGKPKLEMCYLPFEMNALSYRVLYVETLSVCGPLTQPSFCASALSMHVCLCWMFPI